jgi:hypothetical protein
MISLRKLAVACLVLLSCPVIAQANIGESLAELRARYGSAKDMGGQMLFEVRLVNGQIVPAHGTANTVGHFSVDVFFDGDHSAMEIFTRNTSDPVKAEMTQDDIKTILTAAGESMGWSALELQNGKSAWVRSDNKLIARFSPNKTGKIDDASVLVIMLNSK